MVSRPGPGANTGGAVNLETVAEQLLYEVADPARYYTPDVVADFTTVQLAQQGEGVVRVTGGTAKGPATGLLLSGSCAASQT